MHVQKGNITNPIQGRKRDSSPEKPRFRPGRGGSSGPSSAAERRPAPTRRSPIRAVHKERIKIRAVDLLRRTTIARRPNFPAPARHEDRQNDGDQRRRDAETRPSLRAAKPPDTGGCRNRRKRTGGRKHSCGGALPNTMSFVRIGGRRRRLTTVVRAHTPMLRRRASAGGSLQSAWIHPTD